MLPHLGRPAQLHPWQARGLFSSLDHILRNADCLLHADSLLCNAEALRLEAQEQARKAAEEEKRQQLIQVQTDQEDARLASERSVACCYISALAVLIISPAI